MLELRINKTRNIMRQISLQTHDIYSSLIVGYQVQSWHEI